MRYELSPEPFGTDPQPGTVFLRARRSLLRLTIYCPDGHPVPGVEVTVEAGDWKRTVTTTAEGLLEVSIPTPPPPSLELRWTHDGAPRRKTYWLELGHPATREGRARRVSNLFFAFPALRKGREAQLAATEGSAVIGADKHRAALRRTIALLDETGKGAAP